MLCSWTPQKSPNAKRQVVLKDSHSSLGLSCLFFLFERWTLHLIYGLCKKSWLSFWAECAILLPVPDIIQRTVLSVFEELTFFFCVSTPVYPCLEFVFSRDSKTLLHSRLNIRYEELEKSCKYCTCRSVYDTKLVIFFSDAPHRCMMVNIVLCCDDYPWRIGNFDA